MIKTGAANFITSSPNLSLSPNFGLSEVVFIGRSNVGKSSLINSLVNHKNLAKSSQTPGKTKLINFFEINFIDESERYKLIFVDLPGFGYAKVGKSTHEIWSKALDEFVRNRSAIRLFIHLKDSRHFDLDIDLEVANYLKDIKKPDQTILNFYTKSDKLNQSERFKVIKFDPSAVFVSSLNQKGIDKARELIIKGTFGGI